MSMLILS